MKLHIRGEIRKTQTECGREIVPATWLLDQTTRLDDPRVCKWCRVTYESRRPTDGD